MKKWNPFLPVITILLAIDIILRVAGGNGAASAFAQGGADRRPIDLTMARSESGESFVLYRLWSDGSIDVRLVNPFKTPAHEWVNADKAGITFQEGWKKFQVGP